MNDEMIRSALTAIGAACEIAGIMLTQLLANGFEREEAVIICGQYICQLLSGKSGSE